MAYTPGLKRKELALVRKIRRLPIKGKVGVEIGDMVSPDTVVATTLVPGPPVVVNVADQLDVQPDEAAEFMVKKVGEPVSKGEVIARYRAFFGLINKVCKASTQGVIEHISSVSGQVIIREPPVPVELKAYVSGKVVDILPGEGAIIETPGSFIQGIFGIGGESHGQLMVMPGDILKTEDLDERCSNMILVVRKLVGLESMRKAAKLCVKGIVTGTIIEKELAEFMGYEIGVAITGEEQAGFTLIVTEGFGGDLSMSDKTFDLLKRHEGHEASINGATQIRAGVIRPEIIVPLKAANISKLVNVDVEDTASLSQGLDVGTPIRIIGDPYFGSLGQVTRLPPELQVSETESKLRILEAELFDGRRVVVPRANVEIIGE